MSKFKIWIDDDKVLPGDAGNVLASDVLDTDVQRINGFKSGTDVSSKRVNSILRQNSLVSKALMDLSGNDTFDYNSTLENIKSAIKNLSNYTVNFTQASTLDNIASGEQLSTTLGKISKQLDALSNFMKKDNSDEVIRMTATNANNCVKNAYFEPFSPNSEWSKLSRNTDDELLLDENEIVCIKKPLFVGDILCAKGSTTSITLSEPIENMDTIEIEYAYSATSFRPIRAIMQVASKNIAFSAPVYAVHLLGMQYLNVYSADYSSIICGGSIGSGADYNASVRIFGIYKIQYHTKWVS